MDAHADSDWRNGFMFLANQLALDFVNTRPVSSGQPTELIPVFDALLRWFQAARLLIPAEASRLRQEFSDSAAARRTVATAVELREKLRAELVHWEGGAAVHRATLRELNRLMAEHPMRTRLVEGRQGLRTERWFETNQPDDLLAPLAESAAALFAEGNRDRVRRCETCVLHFLDTSKKGSRRWCSMRMCGNRVKVAAYAARRRLS
jgi:predicted RNA-binding Zn ribbon-like protein